MLGFIPKHINRWLGILTNWSTFSIRVCLCLQRAFFFFSPCWLIFIFLPSCSAFWWTGSFLSVGVASLSDAPCILGSSWAGYSWCPCFASYLFNHFINWQLNPYLYWVPIFWGHKGIYSPLKIQWSTIWYLASNTFQSKKMCIWNYSILCRIF